MKAPSARKDCDAPGTSGNVVVLVGVVAMTWLANKLVGGAALIGCAVLAFLLFTQTAALTKANAKLAASELGREEDRRLTSDAALSAAKAAFRSQEIITTKYQGAINAAIQQADIYRRDAAVARTESDELREQAVSAARLLADLDTPAAAVREYAVTVNELFDNCQRDYQSMAGKAQGHAADVATLIAAWPTTAAK